MRPRFVTLHTMDYRLDKPGPLELYIPVDSLVAVQAYELDRGPMFKAVVFVWGREYPFAVLESPLEVLKLFREAELAGEGKS